MEVDRIHATRERETQRAREWNQPLPRAFCSPVVGVTFQDGYPNNLWALQRKVWADGSVPAEFVRDPDNEHDPNAVRIVVNGQTVGHLTRPLATRIAPALDAGMTYAVKVSKITGNSEHLDQPGCQICATLN